MNANNIQEEIHNRFANEQNNCNTDGRKENQEILGLYCQNLGYFLRTDLVLGE